MKVIDLWELVGRQIRFINFTGWTLCLHFRSLLLKVLAINLLNTIEYCWIVVDINNFLIFRIYIWVRSYVTITRKCSTRTLSLIIRILFEYWFWLFSYLRWFHNKKVILIWISFKNVITSFNLKLIIFPKLKLRLCISLIFV